MEDSKNSSQSILIINKDENGETSKIDETTKLIDNKETTEVSSFDRVHKISLIIVMVIGFIANVEYGIVMPSILGYIESLNGNNNDLGWALAMFSFAQVCFLPLVGIWADKRTMKEAFIACLIIGVCGNVVYAMSVQPIMVIVGRFIAGIGSSNMALTTSYIAAVSTKDQRTKYMGMINGINAFGLVAGPAFNLGINAIDCSFWIGKVHFIFDPLRSPGWLLAILLFLTLLSFIFFKEPNIQEKVDLENGVNDKNKLTTEQITPDGESNNNDNIQNKSEKDLERQSFIKKSASHLGLPKYDNNTSINKYKYNTFSKYQSINDEEYGNNSLIYRINKNSNSEQISSTMITPHSSFSHFSSRGKFSKYGHPDQSGQPSASSSIYKLNDKKEEPTFFDNLKKLLDASLMTCFVINFVQNFVFGVLETMITPITQQQYGFKTLQNSIMYSCVSLEIIVFIVFTLIFTGKGGQDKHVILFGMLFLGSGLVLMMFFFGLGLASDYVPIWKFIFSVAVTTVGIPTQNTSVYSLYSKLLNRIYGDDEAQGFASGFMMLMGSAARILGPLWAGYGLEMVRRLPLFIVLIAMFIFDISIVLLFWKKLTFKFDPNAKTSTVIGH